MADALAERVRREVGDDGAAQTRRVFEHVFGRKPDADEAAAALRSARAVFAVQGLRTIALLRETDARLAALAR
jgi:hypothetical protein